MRNLLVVAAALLVGLMAVAIVAPTSSDAQAANSFKVSSRFGWQQTPLNVSKGSEYSVAYKIGDWTVDSQNFDYVGPQGYPPSIDSQIYQGCKLNSNWPYARLLAKVGTNGSPFSVGGSSFSNLGDVRTFTASTNGSLYLRMHDADSCLGDNGGSITVNLSTGKEPGTGQPGDGGSKSEIDYFALGDSVASGHGLQDDKELCRQSSKAYPFRVRDELKKRYKKINFSQELYKEHFLACSGATLTDPKKTRRSVFEWFPAQVGATMNRVSDRPTLVSITIGVDDLRWADPLNFVDKLKIKNDADYEKWVDETTAEVAKLLRPQLESLLSRPNVAVVITEYHNPINKHFWYFGGAHTDKVCAKCYARSEYAIHRLNEALAQTVNKVGQPKRLQIAKIHDAFHRHEAPQWSCGDAPPGRDTTWIQPIGDSSYNSDPPSPPYPPNAHGDCLHPNEKGVQAIAKAVNEAALNIDR